MVAARALRLRAGLFQPFPERGLLGFEARRLRLAEAAPRRPAAPRRIAPVEREAVLRRQAGQHVLVGGVQPLAAEVEGVGRAAARGVGPPAETLARLQHEDVEAGGAQGEGGGDAGGAGADDDRVEARGSV